MKTNSKYIHMAIVNTIVELSSMKKLANALVDAISVDYPGAVEVNDVRGSGFIIRRKKDAQVTDSYITKAMVSAIESVMEDIYDDAVDHISENYDFVYKDSYISESLVSEIFDITRNGRLLYVEADL